MRKRAWQLECFGHGATVDVAIQLDGAFHPMILYAEAIRTIRFVEGSANQRLASALVDLKRFEEVIVFVRRVIRVGLLSIAHDLSTLLCRLSENLKVARHQRQRIRTKNLRVRLDPIEVEALLSRLCIRLGFCLPPKAIEDLCLNPPIGIEEFTEAALVADGYGYTRSDTVCIQARDEVERAFVEHLEQRRQ